jgi:hypothetical protein
MLREVSSKELTEWQAYFSVKNKKEEEQRKLDEARRKAKR